MSKKEKNNDKNIDFLGNWEQLNNIKRDKKDKDDKKPINFLNNWEQLNNIKKS